MPVDVSLYSSAITELYDHRVTPRPYFGGDFGYLSSARTNRSHRLRQAEADKVSEERKIIVVTTDGTQQRRPAASRQRRFSAPTTASISSPGLRGAGIDLLAIGIGSTPITTPNAATILSGWSPSVCS